nr:MAG TPA: major capsid protein [Caudoviricetes sp.]
MIKKRIAEYRTLPTNEKGLEEKRTDLMIEMNQIVQGAKAETRTLTDQEETRFAEIKKEIKKIDTTLSAIEEEQRMQPKKINKDKKKEVSQEELEERAFENFLRDKQEELRVGEIQLTQGNNGVIVPTSIAKRIIEEVRDIVPFLQLADVIPTNGKLSVPVYGEDSTNYINADYVDEGEDLTDNIGKFTSVDLTGYVIGALSLVSKKLVNNTDFDIVSFVVRKIAEALAEKLEKEFIIGTSSKITGITSTTKTVETAAATAITYDELVSLKHSLKQRFRSKGVWIMNPTTYTTICKLKDGNGQPYFKEDEYMILGNKVIESDSMPEIAAENKSIIFGDLSGYTIKATKSVEVQVLIEKYATKYMIGVVGYGEYDGKITDKKKIAALVQKSA